MGQYTSDNQGYVYIENITTAGQAVGGIVVGGFLCDLDLAGDGRVFPLDERRYVFSNIANSSNVRLDNFYWRDTLPAEVRLEKIVTGTYNFPGTYKITYRVNGGEPQTLADNLSTQKNYTLAASATALGLASNERVTDRTDLCDFRPVPPQVLPDCVSLAFPAPACKPPRPEAKRPRRSTRRRWPRRG